MARPLRIEYPGAVYHVTARGNRREAIYLDERDRAVFLEILGDTIGRFGWRCHGYCLMGNHYHLLLETPEPNLSRGMRQLNGVYTQRLNRAHDRGGHVFQGRYKAILVEREAYLLELARYIVLNPVRAGLVAAAGDWRWSSYRACVGEAVAPGWLTVAWLLSLFGGRGGAAEAAFRRFIAEGLADEKSPLAGGLEAAVKGGIALGGEDFVAGLAQKAADAGAENAKLQRHLGRPGLAELRAGGDAKDRAWMVAAQRQHGYTLAEIAAEAGLHYTYVSKIINGMRPK